MANAVLQFLAQKLPVSRLQRDLTDSTVLRNVGVPMGHALIAIQSTLKGLRKLILNEEKLQQDSYQPEDDRADYSRVHSAIGSQPRGKRGTDEHYTNELHWNVS